jgi:alkylhydroperoxidase/carboxymuconolactone decarboxylase family protein YurZ
MKYSPEYFKQLEKRYPSVARSFTRLSEDCACAGPLDINTQRLVKLGVAIGAGIEGDIQNLAMQALTAGTTPDELRHAVLVSVTTAGFPGMIAAMQLVEETITAVEAK